MTVWKCHSDRETDRFRRGISSKYFAFKVNPKYKLEILTSGLTPFLRMTGFRDCYFEIYITIPLRMTDFGECYKIFQAKKPLLGLFIFLFFFFYFISISPTSSPAFTSLVSFSRIPSMFSLLVTITVMSVCLPFYFI